MIADRLGAMPNPERTIRNPRLPTVSDWVYLYTVGDIRHRTEEINAAHRYVLLGLAPLLRKLILDGNSLLTIVNREHGIQPRFAIRPYQQRPAQRFSENRWEVPALAFGREELYNPGGEGVPLSAFLSTPVGEFERKPVTVKELIRYYANVEGGVHRGKPDSEFENAAEVLAPMLLTGSIAWLRTLGWVAKIVADGLEPLTTAVAVAWVDPPFPMAVDMLTVISKSPDDATIPWHLFSPPRDKQPQQPRRRQSRDQSGTTGS